jgi:GPH family glycoside/pentoside/hexuronide:cation symporter
VTAIRAFAGPVPAALLVLAIVFAWRYPITRERHRHLLDELASREN